MQTVTQPIDLMQTLDIDEYSTPWQWGEEDGLEGKSEFTGYDYFAGHSLQVYLAGHASGCAMRQRLLNTVLDEVRTVLKPQSDVETMDEALEAIRQQPRANQKWYAVVEDERVGAEFSSQPYLF